VDRCLLVILSDVIGFAEPIVSVAGEVVGFVSAYKILEGGFG